MRNSPVRTHQMNPTPAAFKCTDRIGASCAVADVNAYLNKRFRQEAKRHKKYTITPLVSLSVSTLERLMKALTELPFANILEGRIREDKKLTRPFEAASKYAQSGIPGRLSVHMEILHKLMDRMTADFGLTDPPALGETIVN